MQEQIKACFALSELKQLLSQQSDQLTVIDVRSPEEFAEKHIPGAINIPLGELESRSGELSKQSMVITACGKGGGRSEQAALLLKQLGFSNANFLCGGTFGWYDESESHN
jgi:rhodanese-related sulfurtransferase